MAPQGYSRFQIILHWATAALLIVSFVSHEAMKDGWRAFLKGQEITGTGVPVHVYTGIAVLVLVLIRLALRWRRGVPASEPGANSLLNRVAGLTHAALYLVLVLLPISGLMAWFGGVREAGEVHEVLFNAGWIVVAMHTAAALFHQYVLKDGLIGRMMRAG
jgi:cytochrome b561